MTYDLQGIENLLKETSEFLEKLETKYHNKKIGYAPKCKVCNSQHLEEIEELRQDGYTYEEILEELEIDNISIMSLSRHFKNHYPKSQKYKKQQELQMLENIREAYLKYPFLEEYFKDQPLRYLEEFNQSKGFCTDKFCLCSLVQASTVSNSYSNVFSLYERQDKEIEELRAKSWSFYGKDDEITELKLKYTMAVNNCLNCKNQIQEERLILLEKIITYNFLNIAPENKELYFNLLQYNGNQEDFIRTLTEVRDETQAK